MLASSKDDWRRKLFRHNEFFKNRKLFKDYLRWHYGLNRMVIATKENENHRGRKMETYRISSHYSMEYPREEYVKNMGEAQRSIDIVCGEFDPVVYNSPKFIERARKLLESNGKLTVIFNGNSKTMAEAIGKIKSWDRNFMYMLSTLKPSVLENVSFYWCPLRPKSHYAILDDSTLIVEEVHDTGKPRDIYCFKEDPATAEEWKNAFEKMKGFCESVPREILVEGVERDDRDMILQSLEDIVKGIK